MEWASMKAVRRAAIPKALGGAFAHCFKRSIGIERETGFFASNQLPAS